MAQRLSRVDGRNMQVSIIIVNWNGRRHLESCLQALATQTRKPDEVIVVDNASTDDSVDFLAMNPAVRVVALAENRGFAGGNIAGYEVARGTYVVLLNNDTKPLPDWLERLVACAEAHDEVGIVASIITDWAGKSIDTAGDGCSVTGHSLKLRMDEPANTSIDGQYVFSACAGAALYKRAMIDDVGFLDPRFFMNAEDADLAFRANLKGWRAYLCADAVVRHRISASQGTYSDRAVYLSARNHVWLYYKCMPTSLMVKYSPSYLMHFLSYVAFFSQRRQVKPLLKGYRDGLTGLASFKADRAWIQGRRRVPVVEIDRRLTLLSSVLAIRVWGRFSRQRP